MLNKQVKTSHEHRLMRALPGRCSCGRASHGGAPGVSQRIRRKPWPLSSEKRFHPQHQASLPAASCSSQPRHHGRCHASCTLAPPTTRKAVNTQASCKHTLQRRTDRLWLNTGDTSCSPLWEPLVPRLTSVHTQQEALPGLHPVGHQVTEEGKGTQAINRFPGRRQAENQTGHLPGEAGAQWTVTME